MRKLYNFFGPLLGIIISVTSVLLVLGFICVQIVTMYKNPCDGIVFSVGGKILNPPPSMEYVWYERIMPMFIGILEILIVGIFCISLLYVIGGTVRYLLVLFNSKKPNSMKLKPIILRGCAGIIVSIVLFILMTLSFTFFPICG